MKIIASLLFVLTMLFATPAHAALGGALYGSVTDAETGEPIDKATVTFSMGLGDIPVRTLPTGYYSVFAPEGWGYVLSAKKEGYKQKVITDVRVVANDFRKYDFVLEPMTRKSTREALARENGIKREFDIQANVMRAVPVWLTTPEGQCISADRTRGHWLFVQHHGIEGCEPFILLRRDIGPGIAHLRRFTLVALNTRYVRASLLGPLIADSTKLDSKSELTAVVGHGQPEIGGGEWVRGRPIRVWLVSGSGLIRRVVSVTKTGAVTANKRVRLGESLESFEQFNLTLKPVDAVPNPK